MWPAIAIIAIVAAIALQRAAAMRARQLAKIIADHEREIQRLRDRQELADERAEAQRRALFDSMVDGFLLLDREGRIQTINEALDQLFALGADARGKSLSQAFPAVDLSELWTMVQRGEEVREFEIELPGALAKHLEVAGAGLRGRHGGLDGAVFIFHDVTRIKQLENTRREFVANVSHELRTPLTLIKGFVETLLQGARNDPAVSKRFLQTIAKHTDRLTFLIEDLLTISRLESGSVVLNKQPFGLRALVQRVFEDFQARSAERSVTLANDVPENLEVFADSDRIQQVLFNLVDNAVKYGRASGTVNVTARRRDDGQIEGCVRDNGPGIPAESLERVFERFYRVDRARSREQGGTGLGLAIVKHIVQSHGGEVWAQSEPGRGCAFFFTLPSAP